MVWRHDVSNNLAGFAPDANPHWLHKAASERDRDPAITNY